MRTKVLSNRHWAIATTVGLWLGMGGLGAGSAASAGIGTGDVTTSSEADAAAKPVAHGAPAMKQPVVPAAVERAERGAPGVGEQVGAKSGRGPASDVGAVPSNAIQSSPSAVESQPLGKPAPMAAGEGRPLVPTEGGARTTGAMDQIVGMALPLGVVVGLMVLGAWVFRKAVRRGSSLAASLGAGGSAPSGVLEVLGRYPVARGQLLVLVKIDRRVLLLGHGAPGKGGAGVGGGFTTLCEISEPEEVASILQKVDDGSGQSFAAKFASTLREHGSGDGVHEAGEATSKGRRRVKGADADWAELLDQERARVEMMAAEGAASDHGATRGSGRDGSGDADDGAVGVDGVHEAGDAARSGRGAREGQFISREPISFQDHLAMGGDRVVGGHTPPDSMAQLKLRLSALNGRSTGGVA